MDEQVNNPSPQERVVEKRRYLKPELSDFGNVKDLTRGAGGPFSDGEFRSLR